MKPENLPAGVSVNEATRTVIYEVERQTWRFRAEIERLGEWESLCGGRPMVDLWREAEGGHMATIVAGLKTLCVEGSVDDLIKLPHWGVMIQVVCATVRLGFPEPDADKTAGKDSAGNPKAARPKAA